MTIGKQINDHREMGLTNWLTGKHASPYATIGFSKTTEGEIIISKPIKTQNFKRGNNLMAAEVMHV